MSLHDDHAASRRDACDATDTCVECVMTWLLFGDGAICLACKCPIYWKGSDGHE